MSGGPHSLKFALILDVDQAPEFPLEGLLDCEGWRGVFTQGRKTSCFLS